MKFIEKAPEPPALRQWRLENQPIPQNLRYPNIPQQAKAEIRASLLAEQGYLCAYTMMRIASENRGHIEHLVAQSRNPDLGVDYANMVYCYPGDGAAHCAFGAHVKDGAAISPATFVSPLDRGCEARFLFQKTGRVAARHDGDAAADATILLLRLNNAELQQARRAAILSLPIFRKGLRPMTAGQARKKASNLMQRDKERKFAPFAVAVCQIVTTYAKQRAAKEATFARQPAR